MEAHDFSKAAKKIRDYKPAGEPNGMKRLAVMIRDNLTSAGYDGLGKELAAIAKKDFGFDHFEDESVGYKGRTVGEVASKHVQQMADGDSSNLASAYLKWLWMRSRSDAETLFELVAFDWANAIRDNERRKQESSKGAVVVGSQSSSLFNLEHVLNSAKKEVTLVAQNHWHMITHMDGSDYYYLDLIGQALGRGANVKIVAMHPDAAPKKGRKPKAGYPDAIELWKYYQNSNAFREHVDLCWSVLAEWDALSKAKWGKLKGKLTIFKAYFLPITISVVDPRQPSGFIVISPRTMEKVSGERPHFVLRKASDGQSFDYYANSIENGVPNLNWTKAF